MPADLPPLIPYSHRDEAGVVAYALLPDAIVVRFRGGVTYLYGARHPGAAHVQAMKQLACAGRGLSSYISRHVRNDYEAQLRD